MLAFEVSGHVHNLVATPFVGRWSWTLPTAFLPFGLLTVGGRTLEPYLRQGRRPWLLNALTNIVLVRLSMDAGFRVESRVCGGL